MLDNLAVSGEHANIFTIGEDSFVQDLNSTNGTFINNKRVAKHHLRNGDTVGIGQHSLVYVHEASRPVAAAPSTSDEFAKTVVISPISAAAPKPSPAPAAADISIPNDRQVAALIVLNGKISGKRIEITKAITNLGKTGKPAGTIARTVEGYLLRAADENDRPKLNGRTVSEEGTRLRNGDIIEVAGTRLQFHLK